MLREELEDECLRGEKGRNKKKKRVTYLRRGQIP
jgi:hypothetical protein